MIEITDFTLIVYAIIIIMGLLCKNNFPLFIFQLLFFYVIAGGNLAAADFLDNEFIFDRASEDSSGLYAISSYYFRTFGFEYVDFNLFWYGIATIFLFVILKKYSKNPCFVMSIIFLYPFLDLVIQKRFFIASMIILGSFIYYVYNSKPKIYIHVLLILIATLFHSAAALFFLFCIVYFLEKKKNKHTILMVLFFLSSFMIAFLPQLLGGLSIVDADKIQLYFELFHNQINYPILSFLCWFLFHASFVYMFSVSVKRNSLSDHILIKRNNKILYLNYISLLLSPLYYWSPAFIRIFRTLILLDYLYLSNLLPTGNLFKKEQFILFSIIIGYFIFIFFVNYFVLGIGYEEIVLPIFTENIVLNLF